MTEAAGIAELDSLHRHPAGVIQEKVPNLFLPQVRQRGPFRDEGTKQLLAEYDVIGLFNPRRRPAYNGGVERANGQLAAYQEAVADFHGRAGLPTCADAEEARQIANDLSHPDGWKGPTSPLKKGSGLEPHTIFPRENRSRRRA